MSLEAAAIIVCVIGIAALITYLLHRYDMKQDNEPYDPRWMDREKWRKSR